MIVQPDFLDHWKTRLLVTLTKEPTAPLMLIRLWGHCQQRRTNKFPNLAAEALAAICQTSLTPTTLKDALLQAGFIEEKGGTIIVHDWDNVNSSLMASWKNGAKGGRPLTQKEPKEKPRDTQAKPTPLLLSTLSSLLNSEEFKKTWEDWQSHRREIKKPLTATSIKEQLAQFEKWGEQRSIKAMRHTIRKGWQGLVEEDQQNGTNQRNNAKGSSRTYGTANEKRIGQYDGVGRLRPVPDVQRPAT